jgi:uncharacterized membrane protein YcjF (UPF0283 family)
MTNFTHIFSARKTFFFLVLSLFSLSAFAQSEVEMADVFRQEGKIYVVITVILIIISALFAYLFVVDRKVGKLEKKINESQD